MGKRTGGDERQSTCAPLRALAGARLKSSERHGDYSIAELQDGRIAESEGLKDSIPSGSPFLQFCILQFCNSCNRDLIPEGAQPHAFALVEALRILALNTGIELHGRASTARACSRSQASSREP